MDIKNLPEKSGYQETSLLWSLSGDHIYDKNMCLKTNDDIDKALTELCADGAVERMSKKIAYPAATGVGEKKIFTRL